MLLSYSKPSKLLPPQIPKSLSIYRKILCHLPLAVTHFTTFPLHPAPFTPTTQSRSTQSILPLIGGLWLRSFPSRRFFLQIISWLTPFFHSHLCSNVTCSREAFFDYPVLTFPQSNPFSLFLPLPSLNVVTECFSLTSIPYIFSYSLPLYWLYLSV